MGGCIGDKQKHLQLRNLCVLVRQYSQNVLFRQFKGFLSHQQSSHHCSKQFAQRVFEFSKRIRSSLEHVYCVFVCQILIVKGKRSCAPQGGGSLAQTWAGQTKSTLLPRPCPRPGARRRRNNNDNSNNTANNDDDNALIVDNHAWVDSSIGAQARGRGGGGGGARGPPARGRRGRRPRCWRRRPNLSTISTYTNATNDSNNTYMYI